MGYRYQNDDDLERSTNRVMGWGAGLMLAMVAVFPLYRWIEPANRNDARQAQQQSLEEQGAMLYDISCASCHGLIGDGRVGPALNSLQFLQSATDEQIELLVAVGVPGSLMSAYSQDFAGPLTSEQIRAITTYIRSWEDEAPDRPDWRSMMNG